MEFDYKTFVHLYGVYKHDGKESFLRKVDEVNPSTDVMTTLMTAAMDERWGTDFIRYFHSKGVDVEYNLCQHCVCDDYIEGHNHESYKCPLRYLHSYTIVESFHSRFDLDTDVNHLNVLLELYPGIGVEILKNNYYSENVQQLLNLLKTHGYHVDMFGNDSVFFSCDPHDTLGTPNPKNILKALCTTYIGDERRTYLESKLPMDTEHRILYANLIESFGRPFRSLKDVLDRIITETIQSRNFATGLIKYNETKALYCEWFDSNDMFGLSGVSDTICEHHQDTEVIDFLLSIDYNEYTLFKNLFNANTPHHLLEYLTTHPKLRELTVSHNDYNRLVKYLDNRQPISLDKNQEHFKLCLECFAQTHINLELLRKALYDRASLRNLVIYLRLLDTFIAESMSSCFDD
jgi:hypothetical protein